MSHQVTIKMPIRNKKFLTKTGNISKAKLKRAIEKLYPDCVVKVEVEK